MLYPLAAPPTQALIDFTVAHPALSPLSGDRVSTFKIDTPLSRIQYAMLPGLITEPGIESYEYQANCWGPLDAVDDIDQAEILARTLCVAIYDMRGTGGVIVSVPTVRPFSLPDPDTGRPRFVCQLRIDTSPEEP